MSSSSPPRFPLDRRDFLKTTGVALAGATVLPQMGCAGPGDAGAGAMAGVPDAWSVRPFPLSSVRLGPGLFQQKRDRMLHYALGFGGEEDWHGGPDRMLSIFRANAGLDTLGAEPPGSWESDTGYLRGHYAGHYMSMLAQAYAGSGDAVYKDKLDYMVAALAECQSALAAAAAEPTPRVPGRFGGGALRLTGSPIGHVEHVRLPDGTTGGLTDFTVATWINLHEYDPDRLPPSNRNQTPATLNNGAAVFDFGSPNPEYAEAPLARMYLVVRVSDEHPVPRFAITTGGEDAEQRLDGTAPLPVDAWAHVAVTRSGSHGTLWVNGEAVATTANMTLTPAELGATDHWLGRRQFPQRATSWLHADLDDFQLWSRALDAGEIRSLVDGEEPAGGSGDVVRYGFDEEGGATATDGSGQGRDGTIIAPTDGGRHPGFLSAYPETQFIRLEDFCTYGSTQGIWAPYYTLHKIMAGLLDAHMKAGNEQALEILTGIGDWAYGRLEPLPPEQLERMWDIYIAGEYGGVNESLAQLHALVPEERYLVAAQRFDNHAVMDPVVEDDDVLDGRHANQHIPQFTGYLRVFEQSADPRYHEAARNFWNMVVPHRIYAHGGMGVGEMFRVRDDIAGSIFDDRNHAETCPLYNMLKLSRNLFFHEQDPKYMNYYEMGLFNQILGSRRDRDSTDSPEVTYFVPVRPGESRHYGNTGTCCGGTGMENHTKYQDSIYFRSADGGTLYVNLYIASTLDWPEEGFTIRQETRFPLEETSKLTVDGRGPLDIRLRVPTWAREGWSVRVNGEEQAVDAAPGTYLSLNRRWQSGDVVEIDFPFRFRAVRAIDDPTVQALYYGPTLLAVQNPPVGDDLENGLLGMSFYPHVKLDGDLAPALATADGTLRFTTNGHTVFPFFEGDPQEGDTHPYHVYWRRREPTVVFGGIDTGVPNGARDDGLTLLDVVWDQAPFADHATFVAAVEGATTQWREAGRFGQSQADAVVDAARRAEGELAVV